MPSGATPFREALAQPKHTGAGHKGFRRKAWGLLVFGLVVAVVCTRATLTAVRQEAAVVSLAQELAASEAAVCTLLQLYTCNHVHHTGDAVALDANSTALCGLPLQAGEYNASSQHTTSSQAS